jgi:hypothetical protein
MLNGGCIRYEFESRLSLVVWRSYPAFPLERLRTLLKGAELDSVTRRCLVLFSVE